MAESRHVGKRILYTAVQWTWGLPQNLGGAAVWIWLKLTGKAGKSRYYHGAVVTDWKVSGSMGLGMFVFFGHRGARDEREVLVHEYGHTVQSCILGPLFLPVIGLPSLLWAALPVFSKIRRKKRITYYDFYPESWANYSGERVLRQKAPKGIHQMRRAEKRKALAAKNEQTD